MFTLPILIFLNEPCPMFIFCLVVFSVYSNCSEIWGLSTPNTIEQWDTSGLYSYPDQTRWLSSTLVWCWVQLRCGRVVVPVFEVTDIKYTISSRSRLHSIHLHFPPLPGHAMCHPLSPAYHLTSTSYLLFNQIPGWPPAGLPQEGASPCYLLSLVAMAGPPQPPRAACHRGLWVCLPSKEGWGLHQPLPLPEGGDPRWVDFVRWTFVTQNKHISLYFSVYFIIVCSH